MKRSNEIDITLTEDGDFVLVDGDFVLAYDMEYIKQQIFHRIKTMNPDWFYDKIGADLEQLLGKPNTRETATLGIDLIREALTNGGFIDAESIYVKPIPVNNETITYFIMIKVDDATKPLTFKVNIALSAGINIEEV